MLNACATPIVTLKSFDLTTVATASAVNIKVINIIIDEI